MIAFHGQESIKKTYLSRVQAHKAADEIIKGSYWEDGKGCAVGCTVHSSDHGAYETELGIPRILARLEDGIFEGLSLVDAKEWPEQFLSAIPIGGDLSLVSSQFLHWLLVDLTDGVICFVNNDRQRAATQAVGDLYGKRLAGSEPTREEWQNAYYAASDAAADAAIYAATAAAAIYAAADAVAYTYAAADAATATATAAAAADATSAAARIIVRQQARKRQAEKLLTLLAAAPIKSKETT